MTAHFRRQAAEERVMPPAFRDREAAAFRLAARLKGRPFTDPLVLAIPRGGVVTGAVLAQELNAELDVVLARKLRAPGHPELALGAVAEGGGLYLNAFGETYRRELADYLAWEQSYQVAEIARRARLFRGVRPAAPVAGRSVIVTDDGIATGATMIAALRAVGGQGPRELIVAVPVASPDRLAEVRRQCDEAVCLVCTEEYTAVGQFYEDFRPVEDDEVVALLRAFAPAARAGLANSPV
jgi:predicted phosphoribosyltransferase